MNRITAIAFLALANLVTAGTSFAQSQGVKVNVPFDFTVGSKLLPAGVYSIRPKSDQMVIIQNREKPITALSLVMPDGKKSPNDGKVIFHRYNGQYFLSEILCDSAEMSFRVTPSRKEKRAQLQQSTLNQSSDTFVAAR